MKAWKCSVCGKVIYSDSVPDVCPLCGVGPEFFELIEENETELHNSDQRIVIIGGGIAAVSAAEQIRSLDRGCSINIYTMEAVLPYDRTRLTKELHNTPHHDFAIHDAAWYEAQNIQLHIDEEIIRIDPDHKQIETVNGVYIPYDELILATGAHAFIPPISGIDLTNVFVLRTLKDAKEIVEVAGKSRRCVIVGGGILGLEAACALADAHMEVDVIESLPYLMAKQLDPLGSEILQAYLEKQKIRIFTNTQVKALHGISRVETIELENGRCLNTDMVLCSTGIRANLHLVKDLPITHDHFIHVDDQMRTSIPHIYACGDVASCEGYHDGLWATAQKQGEIAGMVICGKEAAFTPTHQPMYFHHEEFNLFMIGDIKQMDQHIECLDDKHMMYEKYAYQDGVCSGVLLINAVDHIDEAWKTYQNKKPFPLNK